MYTTHKDWNGGGCGSSPASMSTCVRFPVLGVWLSEETPLPHCRENKRRPSFLCLKSPY